MTEAEVPITLMRPRSGSYHDVVTDAAIRLLAQHGSGGVTLRSLADELRLSPQGVRRWFGSIEGTWDAITRTFARRWVGWLNDVPGRDPQWVPPWQDRGARRGPADHSRLALPQDESELAATRAWLGLRHQVVSRHDPLSLADAQEALRVGLRMALRTVHSRE